MAAAQLLHLSQSQLQILEACPRKFQHIYLEQLSPPPDPIQQEGLIWGSNFHLVMQQRELGLPVGVGISAPEHQRESPGVILDEAMAGAIAALLTTAPELFPPQTPPQTFRAAEHPLTWELHGYLFTVIYDLLIATPEAAQIIDWKTHQKPLKPEFLAQQWQTKLYLYLLAATTGYSPENITMTYWFVKNTPQPQRVTITYNQETHQQIHQELTDLLAELDAALEDYQTKGIEFSQVSPKAGLCLGCSFAARCGRGDRAIDQKIALPDLADVAEVRL